MMAIASSVWSDSEALSVITYMFLKKQTTEQQQQQQWFPIETKHCSQGEKFKKKEFS